MNSETNQSEQSEINPLMIPLLAAMETAINQLFLMDPETFKRLTKFSGKIIAFYVSDINQSFYFFPDHQGIQIISHYAGEADTLISGTLGAFARMAVADEKTKTTTVFNGEIKISGDIALGQHFQALFQQLDIDWEEHVSHFTGDVIAHSLGNAARGVFSWGEQVLNTFAMNVSEYVQYETQDIASGPELNHFNTQVDQIRSDVDRAEARVQRLLLNSSAQQESAE